MKNHLLSCVNVGQVGGGIGLTPKPFAASSVSKYCQSKVGTYTLSRAVGIGYSLPFPLSADRTNMFGPFASSR
jgi:hypothetical protein